MSFTREYAIKAVRKLGVCNGCGKMVELGQPAIRWAGLVDGDFNHSVYHPECRAAEIALNDLHDWRCYDDWIQLRWDRDPEDTPWLVAEHPIVAARLGLTSPRTTDGRVETSEPHGAEGK